MLACIETLTALPRDSRHFWAMVHFARLIGGLDFPSEVARMAEAAYRICVAVLREVHPAWSEEQIGDKLLSLEKLPPHSMGVPQKGVFLDHSVFSLYPRLPSDLATLANAKTLTDLYAAGNYVPIRFTDGFSDLKCRIPLPIMRQMKLLHLFARTSWDNFCGCSFLHTWETLGRTVLHGCGGSRTVTEAYQWLTNS